MLPQEVVVVEIASAVIQRRGRDLHASGDRRQVSILYFEAHDERGEAVNHRRARISTGHRPLQGIGPHLNPLLLLI